MCSARFVRRRSRHLRWVLCTLTGDLRAEPCPHIAGAKKEPAQSTYFAFELMSNSGRASFARGLFMPKDGDSGPALGTFAAVTSRESIAASAKYSQAKSK